MHKQPPFSQAWRPRANALTHALCCVCTPLSVCSKGLGTNVVITLPDSKRVKRLKTFAGIIDNMFRLVFPVGYTIFLFLIFIV